MPERIISRMVWLVALISATNPLTAQPQSLTIADMVPFYSKPSLLDFDFSLRDENNHAIEVNPADIKVVCREDGVAFSRQFSRLSPK